MRFHPGELERVRPSDQNQLKWAFASAILLRAASDAESEGYVHGANQTAAVLLYSAIFLGNEAIAHTRSALAHLALCDHVDPDELPLIIFGVLLSELARREPPDGTHMHRLANACLDEEAAAPTAACRRPSGWLLGLTAFDQRHGLWRSLADHLLRHPARPHPPEAAAVLAAIEAQLSR